jgi:peptidoglycan/LPS O-acetylase OafA/YrhL
MVSIRSRCFSNTYAAVSHGRVPKLGIHPEIDKIFSVYLDLVRLLAALCVFVGHSFLFHMYDGWVSSSISSHGAVVVFFVLSGLVISATAAREGETCSDFILARAARVYSVAVPAVALCYGLGLLYAAVNGWKFDAEWRASAADPFTSISALLFLLQSWHYAELPWNGPYWSLCYEVWYYIIFAALFFGGARARLIGFSAAIVAGPAIVALLPIWWFGVWIMQRPRFSFGHKVVSWAIFCGSLLGIGWLMTSGVDVAVRGFLYDRVPSFWRLNASERLLTDYALGLLVAVNFLAFRDIKSHVSPILSVLSKPIRFWAGYTFSIYLFHYPLIRFCTLEFPNKANSVAHYLTLMLLILAATIVLGTFTEKKKHVARNIIKRVATPVWNGSKEWWTGARAKSASPS